MAANDNVTSVQEILLWFWQTKSDTSNKTACEMKTFQGKFVDRTHEKRKTCHGKLRGFIF
jgi:hypothetical protein